MRSSGVRPRLRMTAALRAMLRCRSCSYSDSPGAADSESDESEEEEEEEVVSEGQEEPSTEGGKSGKGRGEEWEE